MELFYSNSEFLNSNKNEILFTPNKEIEITKSKIHIRIHQRNGKKSITTIEGLESDLDQKRICKAMRKTFNCNGNVTLMKDSEQEVIQLQGDQRENAKNWLIEQEIVSKSDLARLVIHGF